MSEYRLSYPFTPSTLLVPRCYQELHRASGARRGSGNLRAGERLRGRRRQEIISEKRGAAMYVDCVVCARE
jgi:hypothetical protein